MLAVHQVRQGFCSFGTALQQLIQDISTAAIQVFSPVEDHYPAVGLQPFEGDPATTQQKRL